MAAKRKSPNPRAKRPAAPVVATVTNDAPALAVPPTECQALHLGYPACQCGGPLCGSNVTE